MKEKRRRKSRRSQESCVVAAVCVCVCVCQCVIHESVYMCVCVGVFVCTHTYVVSTKDLGSAVESRDRSASLFSFFFFVEQSHPCMHAKHKQRLSLCVSIGPPAHVARPLLHSFALLSSLPSDSEMG